MSDDPRDKPTLHDVVTGTPAGQQAAYVAAAVRRARIDQITEDMGISYESMRINRAELADGNGEAI